MSGLGPAACWLAHKRLESWSRMAKERVDAVRRATERNISGDEGDEKSTTPPPSATSSIASGCDSNGSYDFTTDSEECNLTRDPQPIQPMSSGSSHSINPDILRSPLDLRSSPLHPTFSIKVNLSHLGFKGLHLFLVKGHRGSSPQIRTFGPDGRSSLHGSDTPYVSQYLTRSSSPMRTISLDARSSSPSSNEAELRTPSPSQTSLASLASGSNIIGGSSGNLSALPHSPKIGGRCLSPLLIPPRNSSLASDGVTAPASPLGQLQLDLYTRNEGPVVIPAPSSSPTLGKLHLRVKYDYHLFDLAVHLIEAHNLCSIDDGGFREPYVRLMLNPEVDQRKRQTLIHRGESSPYFDQNFKFPVSKDQLRGKELILQVLEYDRYSHNDVIGEVRIQLDEIDLSGDTEVWGDLVRIKKPVEERPELLVSMNYLPQAERFTVVIMKAKNLDTEQDPYVKLYLIQNGKRVKKKKTSSGKSNDPTNPIWNEQFVFNLPSSAVPGASLEIYLVTTGGEANAIGSCGIGPHEQGTGRQHWYDMIHARKTTAMWHQLR
uniref:C2 domain-containing protein n=1 Tax=Megaselia scalaris TaxID=36166 RepID=T1GH69_MEGSC